MTDYADLIDRLRRVPGPTLLLTYPAQTTPDPLSNEAANAITDLEAELQVSLHVNDQLRARVAKLDAEIGGVYDRLQVAHERIAELEAALKPFSDEASYYEGRGKHLDIGNMGQLTVADLRAARAAYLGEKK